MVKKKILFFSPEFFGIEKKIIKSFKEEGYEVHWENERSIHSALARAINAVIPQLFFLHSNNYYNKIINSIKGEPDIILIVKGEMVTKRTIGKFRKRFPKAKLVLYLWDSVENVKGITSRFDMYDFVLSFDNLDCEKYKLIFRPLFCDLENMQNNNNEPKYDIAFYGTMYGDRFKVVKDAMEYCVKRNLEFYHFCFLRGKFMSFYYWMTCSEFRQIGKKIVSYQAKSLEEIADIIQSTKVILDINDPNQRGMTIRTLETVMLGKKMITTNQEIVNYDFYDMNNILVVNREQFDVPREFIEKEYIPIDENVLHNYSGLGWVNDVLQKIEQKV